MSDIGPDLEQGQINNLEGEQAKPKKLFSPSLHAREAIRLAKIAITGQNRLFKPEEHKPENIIERETGQKIDPRIPTKTTR